MYRRFCLGWLAGLTSVAAVLGLGRVQAQNPQTGGSNIQYTLPAGDASGSIGPSAGGYSSAPLGDFGSPETEPPVVGGYGMKGRIGHEAGAYVGRTQSITYFDLSPYVFVDNLYLYGEGRLMVGNNGHAAGSLGAGGRYYIPKVDAILGGSGWYDADATRGPTFQQWGVSGEFLSEFLDIRNNWYFPYGETYKITNQRFEAGSQHFEDRPVGDVPGDGQAQGSYLVFQRRVFTATAMRGFDTLFSVPIPGAFPQKYNMEASAGFYHFYTQDHSVDELWGWRARLDADVFERLSHMYLEVTNDQVFKTNVIFGIDINYWNKLEYRPRVGHTQYNRLADWVRRQRTVVAYEGSYLAKPEKAINPRTNEAYVIYQVNSANVGGTGGTQTDPFGDLQTAIDRAGTPADIIYVQGNSTFTNAISLHNDFQQVIGEQQVPTIELPVANLSGNVLMPTVTSGSFDTPVISNAAGPAVTLAANNVRFAGFNINNTSGGPAILSQGHNFGGGSILNTIDTVNINTVDGGDGLRLEDSTGTLIVNNLSINDVEGDALHVERGTANILFTGQLNEIDNTNNSHASHGYAAQLIDVSGTMNMTALRIQDTGGQGIRVVGNVTQPSTGNISFGDVTLTDTQASVGEGDVYIDNISGTVTFFSNLTIDHLNGSTGTDLFVVRNLMPQSGISNSGIVTVSGTTNLLNRRGRGIVVDNLQVEGTGTQSGQVRFNGATTISLASGYTGTGAAVDMNSSSGSLNFGNTLTISGSAGNGIDISSIADDGNTLFAGFVSSNTITLNNVVGTSFLISGVDKDSYRVQTNGITINNRGTAGSLVNGRGIQIDDFAGIAQFGGVTNVQNQNQTFANAIDIQTNNAAFTRTTGSVGFQSINVEDQLGANSFGILVQNNGKNIGLGSVNVTSTNATGVRLWDNSVVSISGGILDVTNAIAIDVQTVNGVPPLSLLDPVLQTHDISLQSVSATNDDYGIIVNNSLGSFVVTGSSQGASSGGTISGMDNAAAYFNNTQTVDLRYMRMTGNEVGVLGTNMLQEGGGFDPVMILTGMNISGSDSQAVNVTDVSNFTLQDSSITSNGATDGTQQILYTAATSEIDIDGDGNDDTVNYNVTITNNNITDSSTATIGGSDMILIRTSNAITDPVALTMLFTNNGNPADASNSNSVTSNRSNGNAALDVTWQGPVTATISGNRFQMRTGTNQIGVDMNINGAGDVLIQNNALTAQGTGATGFQLSFEDASQVAIRNNGQMDEQGNFITNTGLVFTGAGSTGFDLSFADPGNQIELTDNLIQFTGNARSGTGVQFSQLVGLNGDTNLYLNGNRIELYPFNNVSSGGVTVFTTERGFYFDFVSGVVTLVGTENNIVTPGANPPYYYDFFGLNSTQTNNTHVLVNGSLVP